MDTNSVASLKPGIMKTSNKSFHKVFCSGVRIIVRRILWINQDLAKFSTKEMTVQWSFVTYRAIHIIRRVVECKRNNILARESICSGRREWHGNLFLTSVNQGT